MEKWIVTGGVPLSGTVRVSGSKNAALPLIFATVLTDATCRIENLPAISDVETSLALLSSMGAVVRRVESTAVEINTQNMQPSLPPPQMIAALRASTYLMGAMLGRFGRAYVQNFGGCNFSPRPIDMHIYAAECLGAKREGALLLAPTGLRGTVIAFDKVSVGATVNALLMATAAKGITVIENAAREPHVDNLICFLRSMGAKIFSLGTALVVEGSPLHGGKAAVVGDMIEGGTYLLAGLCTGGAVSVVGCEAEHLSCLLSHLRAAGASVACGDDGGITVSGALKAPLVLKTAPYPAFPTDLQPQSAITAALFSGAAVTETVFPDRFGYLQMLENMGVSYRRSGSGAYIFPSKLHAASVMAQDLRGGAAVLLAALAAKGESRIGGVSYILRGYADVIEKLSSLGADIKPFKE